MMQTATTPRHVWVVGVLALLWNAMGAVDFTLTQLRSEAYLKAFTPEQLAYFTSLPSWVALVWGLGTWGGFLGAVTLLLRRRCSLKLFTVSLAGMVLTDLYCYVLSDGLKAMGGKVAATIGFSAVIFVVGVLLFVYARAMGRRGVLR